MVLKMTGIGELFRFVLFFQSEKLEAGLPIEKALSKETMY